MAQHFLLTRKAKSLNLATVFRMTDAQAEAEFRAVRWADTNGAPVCPECGGLNAYERQKLDSLFFEVGPDAAGSREGDVALVIDDSAIFTSRAGTRIRSAGFER